MQIIEYPKKERWPEILARPERDAHMREQSVARILDDVEREGDAAVRRYTEKFDGAIVADFLVAPDEIAAAESRVPEDLKRAIRHARGNIERFHAAQKRSAGEAVEKIETTGGVFCWRRAVPIERVGLYVPGGTAPLFSTVLMLAVPARLAGCREIVMCSPPGRNGRIDEAILYTARLCGVTRIYKIGGAQAIGALACGTETVPFVYKIFGPGNQFVTAAKQMVAQRRGVAIDMPAGPSEVAVLADESAVPAFVAADLLSQAEHGPDSQVLLVSTSREMIRETNAEIDKQLAQLPRREIAAAALENSRAILIRTTEIAVELLNEYAAEHLILAVADADGMAGKITSAGSVFIGNYSCEAAGDYASGTNHTLPTAGGARAYSGVSLDSFVKMITFQQLTRDGIRNLGPTIELMARAEQLEGHCNAVAVRMSHIEETDKEAAAATSSAAADAADASPADQVN